MKKEFDLNISCKLIVDTETGIIDYEAETPKDEIEKMASDAVNMLISMSVIEKGLKLLKNKRIAEPGDNQREKTLQQAFTILGMVTGGVGASLIIEIIKKEYSDEDRIDDSNSLSAV